MDLSRLFDARYLSFSDAALDRASIDVDDIVKMADAVPGQSFLEVGCGEGRLVREAARRGLYATGLDVSPIMTNEARSRAERDGVAVTILDWDIRTRPAPGQWDLAASWYTSFGFSEDEDGRRELRNIRASIRPGGTLVMDLIDKDYLLPRMKDTLVHQHGDRLILDRLSYDSESGRIHTQRTYIDGGDRSVVCFSVRLLAFPELRDWLMGSGFGQVTLVRDERSLGRLRVRADT